jgi:hypothetical protein
MYKCMCNEYIWGLKGGRCVFEALWVVVSAWSHPENGFALPTPLNSFQLVLKSYFL